MPSSWTQNYYHIVFATKNREPWLTPSLEQRLYPFLGGISRDLECAALAINGWLDHVHLLVRYPANLSHADMARHLKGRSSKWIHDELDDLQSFAWQEGYGGFTVSASMLDRVKHYIDRQKEHHQTTSFKQELMKLLDLHGIEATEEHVFGPYRPPAGRAGSKEPESRD
ncbi:MAG TPA: IS200/IS605 family transposase [Phycisphaerales bacterium]|nr:IS200/IS605 family transposase [Phycisphaerales bacterium]